MSKTLLIIIGLLATLLTAAGIMRYNEPIYTALWQLHNKNLIISHIFPANSFHNQEIGGWAPTPEEIWAIEPTILDFIKASNQKIYAKIDLYRCQYFGIYVNGRKRIYCNFFRFQYSEWDKDWRTRPIFVDDGGDWYFQLSYDVIDKACRDFSVNGNG